MNGRKKTKEFVLFYFIFILNMKQNKMHLYISPDSMKRETEYIQLIMQIKLINKQIVDLL